MPTVILDPTAVSSPDLWTNVGGANKVISVNLPDDEATTRIQSTTPGDTQYFALENMPANANVINSVVQTSRASESAADASFKSRIKTGLTDIAGATNALTTSWVNYDDVWATAPGGETWTVALLDDTELAVEHVSDTGQFSRVTSMYLTVVYQTDDGEQFLMFLTSWLPPLIAVASHGLGDREIAWILRKMKVRPSDKWEFQKIKRAFILRPRFVFT